jgi:hypothetical protein
MLFSQAHTVDDHLRLYGHKTTNHIIEVEHADVLADVRAIGAGQ